MTKICKAGFLNCDICGRRILGRAFQVIVEGASMSVCANCASLGKPAKQPSPKAKPFVSPVAPKGLPLRQPRPRPQTATLPRAFEQLDLDDSYSLIIREARGDAGLRQEDLARKVNEKLSVIQKIESGRMIPDMKLAKTLEHVLRIKLLVPVAEEPVPASRKRPAPELTLADVAKIKAKDKDAIPV